MAIGIGVSRLALVGRTSMPPLEKRSNGVDSRHDLMGRFRAVADDSDLVLVAGRRQPAIPLHPSVWTTDPASDQQSDVFWSPKAIRPIV